MSGIDILGITLGAIISFALLPFILPLIMMSFAAVITPFLYVFLQFRANIQVTIKDTFLWLYKAWLWLYRIGAIAGVVMFTITIFYQGFHISYLFAILACLFIFFYHKFLLDRLKQGIIFFRSPENTNRTEDDLPPMPKGNPPTDGGYKAPPKMNAYKPPADKTLPASPKQNNFVQQQKKEIGSAPVPPVGTNSGRKEEADIKIGARQPTPSPVPKTPESQLAASATKKNTYSAQIQEPKDSTLTEYKNWVDAEINTIRREINEVGHNSATLDIMDIKLNRLQNKVIVKCGNIRHSNVSLSPDDEDLLEALDSFSSRFHQRRQEIGRKRKELNTK